MWIIWTLVILLLLFWLIGLIFRVGGSLIYLLLLAAAVLFLIGLFSGTRPAAQ